MNQCPECERLWRAYQKAIQCVQLDQEIRSMTEDEALEKLGEPITKAEAAERLRMEARQKLEGGSRASVKSSVAQAAVSMR
jgi:hypothetical protein